MSEPQTIKPLHKFVSAEPKTLTVVSVRDLADLGQAEDHVVVLVKGEDGSQYQGTVVVTEKLQPEDKITVKDDGERDGFPIATKA